MKILEKPFELLKYYLEKQYFSFCVKNVETVTHTFELESKSSTLCITEKETNNKTFVKNADYNFMAGKKCEFTFPKSTRLTNKIFGLKDVKSQICLQLNINGSKLICLYGPNGCGKNSLMMMSEDLMDNKHFLWIDFKLLKSKDYLPMISKAIMIQTYALVDIHQSNDNIRKKVVLCVDAFDLIQTDYPEAVKFMQDLLDDSKLDIKIMITLPDFSLIKSSRMLAKASLILVRNLNREEAFEFLKYLIESVTNKKELDEAGLYEFAGTLKAFSGRHIENFVYNVARKYPELTLENLRSCRQDPDFIPFHLLKHLASLEPLHWSDIGGYEHVKALLMEEIGTPLLAGRTDMARGVILHGPPGCSKTMFARALATECGLDVFLIRPSNILRGYLGESEKLLRQIMIQATATEPSIIFIDEIDTLFPSREGMWNAPVNQRLLSELLTFLDGISTDKSHRVIFMGATNYLNKVDQALIRKGRVDLHIEIGKPDQASRESILKIIFSDPDFAVEKDVIGNISFIATKLEQRSGADIVCFGGRIKKCAQQSMNDFSSIPVITMAHVSTVIPLS